MAIKNKTLALIVASAQTLIREEKISEQDKAAALLELARSLSGGQSATASVKIAGSTPEEREESMETAIVDFLRENGPASGKDIAAALGLAYNPKWNDQMRTLVDLGVIQHNGMRTRGSQYYIDRKKVKRKLRAVA